MPLPNDPDHRLALPPLQLVLMPERAVFEPVSRTLYVADLHLGKAAVFRARGLPVPQGTSAGTLLRLSRAIDRSGAQRLVVLGDFLHARESQSQGTLEALGAWRAAHPDLPCFVVEGNHDRHAGRVAAHWGFEQVNGDYVDGALRGVHDPAGASVATHWTLAGHVHPVVRLGSRHDTLRLPCFWLHKRVLTLPSFGEFTGGYLIRPAPGDALFAVGEQVLPLPVR